MTDDDTVEVAVADLQDLYSTLARATEAHAAGDSNTCAAKAADAKETVLEMAPDDGGGR